MFNMNLVCNIKKSKHLLVKLFWLIYSAKAKVDPLQSWVETWRLLRMHPHP
jgi:hypothetical protein